MALEHVAAPKMLAPQSRLADLGGTVIPEQGTPSNGLHWEAVAEKGIASF